MKGRHRYHLVMPSKLFKDVQAVSEARGTTVITTLIACIRIGLLVFKAADKGQPIIVREGRNESELLLL